MSWIPARRAVGSQEVLEVEASSDSSPVSSWSSIRWCLKLVLDRQRKPHILHLKQTTGSAHCLVGANTGELDRPSCRESETGTVHALAGVKAVAGVNKVAAVPAELMINVDSALL